MVIVSVILATLAGLAFPVIAAQVERSRSQEAIQHLDSVKDSLQAFRGLNGKYTGAAFPILGYDPNTATAGQNVLFSYALSNVGAATYTITAQREPLADNAGNTITLDQDGVLTPKGAYA